MPDREFYYLIVQLLLKVGPIFPSAQRNHKLKDMLELGVKVLHPDRIGGIAVVPSCSYEKKG